MKKFIIILLIALVASSTVTIETGELNSFISKLLDKAKNWLKKLTGILKDAYNWIHDNGLWDTFVGLVKEYGKPYAISACESVCPIPSACSGLADKIFDSL